MVCTSPHENRRWNRAARCGDAGRITWSRHVVDCVRIARAAECDQRFRAVGRVPGTDVFDTVAAVDQWVTTGKKPQSIEAAHLTVGMVDRTRPLCAYPTTAHYTGSGSTDDAKNFRCQ
jgi:hypothetical protein